MLCSGSILVIHITCAYELTILTWYESVLSNAYLELGETALFLQKRPDSHSVRVGPTVNECTLLLIRQDEQKTRSNFSLSWEAVLPLQFLLSAVIMYPPRQWQAWLK